MSSSGAFKSPQKQFTDRPAPSGISGERLIPHPGVLDKHQDVSSQLEKFLNVYNTPGKRPMPEPLPEYEGRYVKNRDQSRFRGSNRFNADKTPIRKSLSVEVPPNLATTPSASYGRAINEEEKNNCLYDLDRVLPPAPRERLNSSNSLQEFYFDSHNKAKSLPMNTSPSVISNPEFVEHQNRFNTPFESSQAHLLNRNGLRRSGRFRYKKSGGFFRAGSFRSLKKWMTRKKDVKSQDVPHTPAMIQNGPGVLDLAAPPPRPPPQHPYRQGYAPVEQPQPSAGTSWVQNGDDSGLETPNSEYLNGYREPRGGTTPLPKELPTPALVGIQNHGNTCYINAVIQCLSNTDALAHYFVSDRYVSDFVNKVG